MTQNKINLRKQQQDIQNEMSELLKKIRIDNGIKNTFIITRELGLSTATLIKIENGVNFPTSRTLALLMKKYVITPQEKETLLELKKRMLSVRRKLRQEKLNGGRM